MASFDALKATNQTAFETKQKQKDYTRFLTRVDKITRRKHVLDHSSSFYMNALRQHKESSNQLIRQQASSVMDMENCVLLEKLANIQKRKKEKYAQYEVSSYHKRKRELERINQQNQALAARLAERYTKCRQPLASLSLHSRSHSGRMRSMPSHAKLPKLNRKHEQTEMSVDASKKAEEVYPAQPPTLE